MRNLLLISFFYLVSYSYGHCEEVQALDNAGIDELARAHHSSESKAQNLIGKQVSIRVSIHVRDDKSAYARIQAPNGNVEHTWAANLINFDQDFFANISDAGVYKLEGSIVENRMDYGAFWIYVNRCEKIEPSNSDNPE